MSNNTFILKELRRLLSDAYRRDFDASVVADIAWTDALCKNFAEHITREIEYTFSEDARSRNDHFVSETTVQRVMNRQFVLKENIHWTTRRILNNLVKYLGFRNWNEFVNENGKLVGHINETGIRAENMSDIDLEVLRLSIQSAQKGKEAELNFYKGLIDEEMLKEFFDEEGEEYKRIIRCIDSMDYKGLEMKDTDTINPSYFTLNKSILTYVEGKKAILTSVFTLQHWYNINTRTLDFYFALLTFQYIFFTYDFKIDEIIYQPFCERDKEIVNDVYRYGFIPLEYHTRGPII